MVCGTLLGVAASAFAQTGDYPSRPIRLITPAQPGGTTDILSRMFGTKLTDSVKQQVVVDNRASASGVLAGELTAKAAPDGYTIFMTSGSIVTANQHIYKKMPFDPEKDLAAITGVASGPQLIAVNPSAPAKTLKDFIALEIGRAHV